MKGRLSSTIWTVVIANFAAMTFILLLGYWAGGWTKGLQITDAFSDTNAGKDLLLAMVVLLGVVAFTVVTLANKVLTPAKELTEFSERLAAGEYRAKADVESNNDFSLVAENLNRTAE